MRNILIKTICTAAVLCLIVCPLLLLAGCGLAADAPGQKDAAEITVWAHQGQPDERKTLQSIIDEFNAAHNDISARIEFKDDLGYGDIVNAALISGRLPDVLEVDGPYVASFAETGVLVPIDHHIPATMKDDFFDTIITQGTYNSRLYTLGAFDSTVVLFYNRRILEECGITPPEQVELAWSWEEFVEVLQTIKREKPELLPLETFMPWGGEWLTYAFTPLLWSNGGQVLSADGKKASGYLDGEANIEALTAWQELFTKGLADVNAAPGQFEQEQTAMSWGVFNRWPLYQDIPIDFGMAPLPFFAAHSSPSGSWCWGITSASQDQEAAAAVLKWILDAEKGVVPICKANGGIPARQSAVQLMPDYTETRQLFIDQLEKSARSRPSTPAYGNVTSEVSRALAEIAQGADVKRTLTEAARAIDTWSGVHFLEGNQTP